VIRQPNKREERHRYAMYVEVQKVEIYTHSSVFKVRREEGTKSTERLKGYYRCIRIHKMRRWRINLRTE